MMPKIIPLSEDIIGKIAAGEVVERPAAAVKELVENSLDAGAAAVTVEIREGGLESIRVTDNGCGIEEGDLRLAFARHATSKLRRAEDLATVATLGFRGEALASIAAVARVSLLTHPRSRDTGLKVVNEGGRIVKIGEAACPPGTTVLVEDLFYNAPVRRGFMKKPSSEAAAVGDLLMRLILSRPDVSFRFLSNGKVVYQSAGDGRLSSAIHAVFGAAALKAMRQVDGMENGVLLKGFVGVGELARGNRNNECFFINGRLMFSPLLSSALEEACRERVMIGKFPICVLHLTIPYEAVDVNVHPNKLEVRFRDETAVSEAIKALVLESLRDRDALERPVPLRLVPEKAGPAHILSEPAGELSGFQTSPAKPAEEIPGLQTLTAEPTGEFPGLQTSIAEPTGEFPELQTSTAEPTGEHPGFQTLPAGRSGELPGFQTPSAEPTGELPGFQTSSAEPTGELPGFQTPPAKPAVELVSDPDNLKTPPDSFSVSVSDTIPPAAQEITPVRSPELILCETPLSSPAVPDPSNDPSPQPTQDPLFHPMEGEQTESFLASEPLPMRIFGALFDTFILIEYHDQLLLVDQHAVHERLLFDRMMAEFVAGEQMASQELLVPLVFSATHHEQQILSENRELLQKIGLSVEPFGETDIAVRAVPMVLGEPETLPFIREVIADLESGKNPGFEKKRAAVLQTACKHAVKGGEKLPESVLRDLVETMVLKKVTPTCPHGRPLVVSVSHRELDRKFKRIQN